MKKMSKGEIEAVVNEAYALNLEVKVKTERLESLKAEIREYANHKPMAIEGKTAIAILQITGPTKRIKTEDVKFYFGQHSLGEAEFNRLSNEAKLEAGVEAMLALQLMEIGPPQERLSFALKEKAARAKASAAIPFKKRA